MSWQVPSPEGVEQGALIERGLRMRAWRVGVRRGRREREMCIAGVTEFFETWDGWNCFVLFCGETQKIENAI